MSPAGLPIEQQVLGEYSLSQPHKRDVGFLLNSIRAPGDFGERRHMPPFYFLIVPNRKRQPYHMKTGQIVSISIITYLSRPYLKTLAYPDERHIYICMGDLGKLRFSELDHDESKMRLLKTHSHTPNGLAMEPGAHEEKQLKEKRRPYNKANHPSKTCRVPPVWRGGGRKGSRTCRIPPVWRGGAKKAPQQTNHRKGTMARRWVMMAWKISVSTTEDKVYLVRFLDDPGPI